MGALRTRKQTGLFGVQVSSATPFCIGKKEIERKPKRPAPARQPSPPAELGGTQRRDPKAEYLEHEARKLSGELYNISEPKLAVNQKQTSRNC